MASKGKKQARPTGRPSSHSASLGDFICEQIADGKSLRSICAAEGMPHKATVFRWLAENERFRDQYARAREAQADALADEILDIADNGENDSYTDENGNVRTDHDVIARSKLRVDARKWIASKLKPKVYSERVFQEHSVHPLADMSASEVQAHLQTIAALRKAKEKAVA